MDTKHLETTAEDLISHKLQRAGMLVAKPKFDVEGTDLLVFLDMGDGVKFCRIQCKGRSLHGSSAKSNVKIPIAYVTNGFVLILYIDNGDITINPSLYCFFASDVRRFRKTPDNQYRLSFEYSSFESKLKPYAFDDSKVRLIETLIRSAEISGEFRSLVYGPADVTLGSMRADGRGYCVGGNPPEPPLDGFPLLAHTPGAFGNDVHTEDGRASVRDVAIAFAQTPSAQIIAAKFGTTVDHVTQAVNYARKAGIPGS